MEIRARKRGILDEIRLWLSCHEEEVEEDEYGKGEIMGWKEDKKGQI